MWKNNHNNIKLRFVTKVDFTFIQTRKHNVPIRTSPSLEIQSTCLDDYKSTQNIFKVSNLKCRETDRSS